MKKFWLITSLSALIFLVGLTLSACSLQSASNPPVVAAPSTTAADWEGLAKALTKAGVKMYGAFWCSHCKNQEKMFGDAFKYVTYIESSTPDGNGQTAAAKAANIQGYPTWVFPDGSRVESEMTFQQLAQKIGFTAAP